MSRSAGSVVVRDAGRGTRWWRRWKRYPAGVEAGTRSEPLPIRSIPAGTGERFDERTRRVRPGAGRRFSCRFARAIRRRSGRGQIHVAPAVCGGIFPKSRQSPLRQRRRVAGASAVTRGTSGSHERWVVCSWRDVNGSRLDPGGKDRTGPGRGGLDSDHARRGFDQRTRQRRAGSRFRQRAPSAWQKGPGYPSFWWGILQRRALWLVRRSWSI